LYVHDGNPKFLNAKTFISELNYNLSTNLVHQQVLSFGDLQICSIHDGKNIMLYPLKEYTTTTFINAKAYGHQSLSIITNNLNISFKHHHTS